MKYKKVEGHVDLIRDDTTGAVLNINNQEIEAARKRKQAKIDRQKKEEALEKDVSELKQNMSEIKDLLTKLVEG